MRDTLKECEFLYNENKELIGVDLGADYAAEHECGIKELRELFGCNPKKMGLNSAKIENLSNFYSGKLSLKEAVWYYLSSSNVEDNPYQLDWKTQTEKTTCTLIKAGWDKKGFAVISTNKEAIETIRSFFDKKDVLLGVGNSSTPFGNGGFIILKFSAVPKETMQKSIDAQKAYSKNKNSLEESKAFKKLKAKDAEWREKYPFCSNSPWSYMYLGADSNSDKYWMNPENQQHINSGWLSLKDIEDWADEKVGKCIMSAEKFDELKYMCSMPFYMYSFSPESSSGRKHFGGVSHLLYCKSSRVNPIKQGKKLKGDRFLTLPLESEQMFESFIKYSILDDLFSQIGAYNFTSMSTEELKYYFVRYIDSKPKDKLTIRKSTENEMYGFFRMLNLLGYGEYGACNTDQGMGKHNIAWWKDLLSTEADFDFINLCGMLREDWK